MSCTDPHRHHHRDTLLTLRRSDGTAMAQVEVTLAQRSHAFPFANIGFDFVGLANGEDPTAAGSDVFGSADPASARQLADLWLEVFNTATLPFYWQGFEPVRGQPDTERLLRAARWFRERGVSLKGHPLVWHTLAPDWLAELPDEQAEEVLRARIRREVSDFSGLVETWDAINEAVIMPVFSNEETHNAVTRLCRRNGRIATVRLAFEEARRADPGVTLVLNDFDMSTAYECLIEGVLEAGIEVDAVGLQSHMHQGYWGEEKTLDVIERFARYGLPLHFTETTLLSGDLMPEHVVDLNDYQPAQWPSTPEGEARQVDEIVRHYRLLLSQPSVQSVTYWGITDQGSWLGAPAGLVRADGSPKPAYDALRRLVKEEWWVPPTRLRTDAAGQVAVRGWAGEYSVTAEGGTATFALAETGAATDLTLGD